MKSTGLIYILLISIFILNTSCQEEGDIGLGLNTVESEVIALDTFTVLTSTVLLDSMATSGTNQILVGNYTDDYLGDISSKSYFQIGLPINLEIRESAVFDSVSIILPYTYYQGDTNQLQNISVHALSEELAFRDDEFALYNINSFDFEQMPLGNNSFYPRPGRGKALEIRLTDALGSSWMSLIQENSENFDTQDEFLDFFPGIVLDSDLTQGNCMLGFNAASFSVDDGSETVGTLIRLYYREAGEEKSLDFPLINSTLQFNEINNLRSHTILANLVSQREALSSNLTNKETFMQAGVGLLTKVEIPYIDKILELGQTSITMYAELIIRPVNNTYDYNRLPFNFNIFEGDRINRLGSAFSFNARTGLDTEFDQATFYALDVTDYILNEINVEQFNDNALLISLPELTSTFERMVIGNNRHPTNPLQLRVIITQFN